MKRHLAIATLLLCAAVVVVTLVALLKLRFEAGDVYPPYSTLRADPLGAMALYESLQRLPGISVRRDFQATNRLPGGWDTTYLQLAGEISLWRKLPEDVVQAIERFMIEGGRLVILLSPQTREDFSERKETRGGEGNRIGKKPIRRKNVPMANPKTTGFPFPNGGISSLALRHWNRTKTAASRLL